MSTLLSEMIDVLSRDKNIDRQVIIEATQDAVTTAARKHFKSKENLTVIYNEETGQLELYALKQVTDHLTSPETEVALEEALQVDENAEVGDMLYYPRLEAIEEMGRIAAQTAKQIIFQKVREAERNNIYNEYIGRVGEMVNGAVKRFERGNIIVDLGKVEALLPRSQQSPAESFSQGDRVRVVIHDVNREAKGPQVEVSRTDPELVKRLFETEVPEIYDGTVVIKAAVREPGDRAKVAVASNDPDVDPVGACVGMKGSRVQAVIRELRGEKIDIIPWSEDPMVFADHALSPAKVSRVKIIDFQSQHLEVVVEDSQLSLAIGKKGQNVRLAAKLVGWHIDIRSEGEMKREADSQMEALMSGGAKALVDVSAIIKPAYAKRLASVGIETVPQLAEADVNEIAQTLDVSLDEATELIERAQRESPALEPADADSPAVVADAEAAAELENAASDVTPAEVASGMESDGAGGTELPGGETEP
jgi:transcription termination/antitermination protein NusA